MTDPVDEYLKTKRGKEALAHQLGSLFDKGEEVRPSLVSEERNDEFAAMLEEVIPVLKTGGKVRVTTSAWGSKVQLHLPLRFGFQGGFVNDVLYPVGNERRSIEEFIDQLQKGAAKELGLDRLVEREREKAFAEGRAEGHRAGFREGSTRQAGMLILEKAERAQSDLAAVRAAHGVTTL